MTISDWPVGLTVVSGQTVSFNASVDTQEELEEKAHNFELEESGSTILCIDYTQNGIGSNSCEPDLSEQNRFDDARLCSRFRCVPLEEPELMI